MSIPISTPLAATVTETRPSRLLSWGAIFGGCFAALSIHILLTMLGLGVGVRLVDPAANDNPVGDFTVASGIVWSVSALISLAIGGWVAGRCIAVGERRIGAVHGFLVWSLSTVVMFLFLSSSAGLLVGGAAKAVGKGFSSAAGAVGSAGQQAAQSGAGQWAADLARGMVDEVRLPNQDQIPFAAKREIGTSLAQFAAQPTDQNRTALVNSLTSAGASREFADTTVRRWEDSLNRLRTQTQQAADQAAQAARQAADKASKGVSQGAIWTFVGFLLGAISATLGGRMGAQSALEAPAREASDDYPRREDVRRREDITR